MWKNCKRKMEPLGKRLKLKGRQLRKFHTLDSRKLTPAEVFIVWEWEKREGGIWF